MAQFDNTLETNMLQQIASIISNGYIKIFSGALGVDTNAADPTNTLVTLQLPANALGINGYPSGGVVTRLGTAVIAPPIAGITGTLAQTLAANTLVPTPPMLDGVVNGYNDAGTSVSLTLSTTKPNDFIFLCVETPVNLTGVSGGGLTWNNISVVVETSGVQLSVFSAIAPQPLTNAVITVTASTSTYIWAGAVAVNNSTLSMDGVAVTQNAAATDLQFTTTAPNDMVFAFWNHNTNASPPVASGWTTIWGNTTRWALGQYRIVPTASTISCQDGLLSDANGGIAWAVQQL